MKRKFNVTWHADVEAESAQDAAEKVQLRFNCNIPDIVGTFGVHDMLRGRLRYFDCADLTPRDITDPHKGITVAQHIEGRIKNFV